MLGDFNGNIGRHIDGVYGGYGVHQKNLEGKMLLTFCMEKELSMLSICFKREEMRKMIFRM